MAAVMTRDLSKFQMSLSDRADHSSSSGYPKPHGFNSARRWSFMLCGAANWTRPLLVSRSDQNLSTDEMFMSRFFYSKSAKLALRERPRKVAAESDMPTPGRTEKVHSRPGKFVYLFVGLKLFRSVQTITGLCPFYA